MLLIFVFCRYLCYFCKFDFKIKKKSVHDPLLLHNANLIYPLHSFLPEMDIFGGVLDIIGGVAEFGLDIHRGHGDSDTQVTDYSKDGLNFVIDVLKGVTKFVGSSRDREIILKVIEGLDTTGM